MCYEAGLVVFELEGRFIVTFESEFDECRCGSL